MFDPSILVGLHIPLKWFISDHSDFLSQNQAFLLVSDPRNSPTASLKSESEVSFEPLPV